MPIQIDKHSASDDRLSWSFYVTEYLIAIILGFVEGVTEYLPISSTGHLILTGEALSFHDDIAKSFDVIIQVGAILAVVILFHQRFVGLFKDPLNVSRIWERGLEGSAGLMKLAMVTAPAVVMALLFKDFIKGKLFGPLPVAVALAVGAVVILLVEGRSSRGDTGKSIEDLTWKESFLIGCVQCAALWPGMSRSASAIIGGMLVGLNRKAAAEFSFLAAVPVLFAASAKESLDVFDVLTGKHVQLIVIGLAVSFVTALLTVKWFIGFVSRVSLRPFAWYRLALALLVVVLVSTGRLQSHSSTVPNEQSSAEVAVSEELN